MSNNIDPSAAILRKCSDLIILLNVNLNHFPKHEKYGLCQEIRQHAYGILSTLIECQKRYQNKTSLTRLDIQHEQLRVMVNLAHEIGYFMFEHHRRARTQTEALRRYTAVSILINEMGAMIGGWIRSTRRDAVTE